MYIFTFSGSLTGDTTPRNQRTGRRQTYKSSVWRKATFNERIPPPTGVVNGPLMPIRYSLKTSIVSSGNHEPVARKARSPASTSFHSIRRAPPYDMSTAASTIACMAGVISAPTPSPVIKGIVGTSGTDNTPFCCLVILLIYLSFYILLQSCSEVKVRWFRTNTPYLLN